MFFEVPKARLRSPETETLSPDDNGTVAEPLIQHSALLGRRDCGLRMEIISVDMPALFRRTTTRSA